MSTSRKEHHRYGPHPSTFYPGVHITKSEPGQAIWENMFGSGKTTNDRHPHTFYPGVHITKSEPGQAIWANMFGSGKTTNSRHLYRTASPLKTSQADDLGYDGHRPHTYTPGVWQHDCPQEGWHRWGNYFGGGCIQVTPGSQELRTSQGLVSPRSYNLSTYRPYDTRSSTRELLAGSFNGHRSGSFNDRQYPQTSSERRGPQCPPGEVGWGNQFGSGCTTDGRRLNTSANLRGTANGMRSPRCNGNTLYNGRTVPPKWTDSSDTWASMFGEPPYTGLRSYRM